MENKALQRFLSPPNYSDEINFKILKLLNENFLQAAPILLLNASFLLYVLLSSAHKGMLLSWYIVTILIVIIRIFETMFFLRKATVKSYKHWYMRYMIGVIASSLSWAVLPVLFFTPEHIVHNFLIAFVLLGIASGATATLSADLKLTRIYQFALLLPIWILFWSHGGELYVITGFMTLFYLFLVNVTSKKFHDNIIGTYLTQELYSQSQESLHEHEKRLSMMFQQAPTGIFYYDNDLTIIDCNSKLEEIMRAPREKLVGLNLNNIPDSRPLDAMRASLQEMKPTKYEGPYNTKVAGLNLIVKIQMTPLIDKDGSVHGGLCIMEDKTSEHQALQEAKYLSLHDALTGLPNRKLLKERMEQIVAEQERKQTYSALLFLDLDHFKQINDSLGHNIGDKMLIETAKRLQETLRKSDTLSRLGGDEFVILLPHLSQDESQAIHLSYEVAQKIHHAMSESFYIEEHALFSSTSIGIALFDAKILECDEILRRADMAMYQSKSGGRKQTSFYNLDMDKKLQHYIKIKKNLHYAIEKDEFTLNYQPILSINNNQIVAAEVLLRWKHGNTMASTLELIKVAEESSLINEIGCWVIEESCKQLQQWISNGQFTLKYITVNISARQLLEKGFPDFILTTLKKYNIQHQMLKLEITETALIGNFEKAKEVIDRLNNSGLDFIIDDFGTGYSSLSYLKMLPFSALKIDKSFVKDILTDPEDEKLIRAIIHTAQQFDYQIIAEGIEEEAQRALLKTINPNIYFQGFLISKPVPAEEFEPYLNA